MNTKNQKIPIPFSRTEIALLQGHFAQIGRTYETTGAYVGQIARGDRESKSKTASEILASLTRLLKTLKEIHFKKKQLI